MDTDTIFATLPYGETVVGKYRFTERCCRDETIIVLTNLRLLVRWRQTFCLCLHQSSYSSIALNSINRVDEGRPDRYKLVTYVALLLSGLVAMIVGFAEKNSYVWPVGIAMLVIAGILLLLLCLSLRKKFVTVKGTFGSLSFKFDKSIAREFESRLNEMIYMPPETNGNTQTNLPRSTWMPSAPYDSDQSKTVSYSKLRNESVVNF